MTNEPTTTVAPIRPNELTLTAAPIRRRNPRRRTLTAEMVTVGTTADRRTQLVDAFELGRTARNVPDVVDDAYGLFAHIRTLHGFESVVRPLLLTAPSANLKLDKGELPAYGLTLQSFVWSASDGRRFNSCPRAGHCVKVCVLNNGNGRYDSVQRARDARSEFLAKYPTHALAVIGWELGRAVRRHGAITFRPNVNSDVAWFDVVGDGFRSLSGVTSYGYSKRNLRADRGEALHFEAMSWGERTTADELRAAVAVGRPIAAVTDRRPGEPVHQWADLPGYRVVDADATDEWMFEPYVIGDLSAKGSARDLIGRSAFVHSVHAYSLTS